MEFLTTMRPSISPNNPFTSTTQLFNGRPALASKQKLSCHCKLQSVFNVLRCAVLCCAVLCCVVLCCVVSCCVVLCHMLPVCVVFICIFCVVWFVLNNMSCVHCFYCVLRYVVCIVFIVCYVADCINRNITMVLCYCYTAMFVLNIDYMCSPCLSISKVTQAEPFASPVVLLCNRSCSTS